MAGRRSASARTIEFGNMDGDLRLLTIVGIVGDTREYGPRAAAATHHIRQSRAATAILDNRRDAIERRSAVHHVRCPCGTAAMSRPRRRRASERSQQIYAASLGPRRFNLTLVGVFAGTALILAVAGIYGVMAYDVTRRRREIGVRMALGASAGDVMRIVLGQGLVTIATGIGVGVVGALGLTRGVQSLLFDVTPTDPIAFATVVLGLAGVAAVACYLPARSGTRVNPVEALRE